MCLGYRHVPLRSMGNQPLELSTLFVYFHIDDDPCAEPLPSPVSLHQNDDRPESKKPLKAIVSKMKDDSTKAEKEVPLL